MKLFNNETIIKIPPNLRQGKAALKTIAKVHSDIINSDYSKIKIDITETQFINPVLIPTIAALPRLTRNNKKVSIIYSNKNDKMLKQLKSQGILSHYNISQDKKETKNIIPFTKIEDDNTIIPVLNKIFELAPINLRADAHDVLFSYLYEMFINATTHGKSEAGAFCCGKWETEQNQLVFSVYDLGIGIKNSVNNFLKHEYSTKETMDWAFTEGYSTKETEYPRGVGFSRLESFINLNKGKITICSSDGIFTIKDNTREYEEMKHEFIGTLIIINIRADNEHIYVVE